MPSWLITDKELCGFFRLGRISTSAEMPRRSCKRRIIPMDSPRLRLRTSAMRSPRADEFLQVPLCEFLLRHPQFDRLNWIRWIHWIVCSAS